MKRKPLRVVLGVGFCAVDDLGYMQLYSGFDGVRIPYRGLNRIQDKSIRLVAEILPEKRRKK